MENSFSDIDTKIKALASKLGIDAKEIGTVGLSNISFETDDGEEYLILTDDESDEICAENIKETLWAFRPEWLASHSIGDEIGEEIFKAISNNGECEGNNSAILALVDFDYLVKDSILADGRGHFISSYDGEEIELEGGLFAYRID